MAVAVVVAVGAVVVDVFVVVAVIVVVAVVVDVDAVVVAAIIVDIAGLQTSHGLTDGAAKTPTIAGQGLRSVPWLKFRLVDILYAF